MKSEINYQYGYGVLITAIGFMVWVFDFNWETLLGVTIFSGFYMVIQLLSKIVNILNQRK